MNLVQKMREVREKQSTILDQRLNQFKALKNSESNVLFKELCFCLLTANFSAERAIRIQERIGDGFLTLSEKELALKLRELGYRFPNRRAEFIIEARQYKDRLKDLMKLPELEFRNWLVQNIKGIGMKEASHFMRNTGFTNVAIIDFHIIDLLEHEGLIERPKTLTKKKYLEIEETLHGLGTNLAELDLILWYLETGKILK